MTENQRNESLAGRLTQIWRLALARRTTVALWILVVIGAGSCVGLFLALRSCSGLACSVATFGGHPQLTLALAAAGTAALLAAAVVTRGFTRVGTLWLVIPAAGLTLASVAGILVLFIATALILLAAMLVIVLLFAFFADHT